MGVGVASKILGHRDQSILHRRYLLFAQKLKFERVSAKKEITLAINSTLLWRFNCHQIPHIDVGSGSHKAIAILRRRTHSKRGLNGRHQNSMQIASLRSETLYTLNQFERKFHTQKMYIKELLYIFLDNFRPQKNSARASYFSVHHAT